MEAESNPKAVLVSMDVLRTMLAVDPDDLVGQRPGEALSVDDIRRAQAASRTNRILDAVTEVGRILRAPLRVLEERGTENERKLLLDPDRSGYDCYDLDYLDVVEESVPLPIASRLRADGDGITKNAARLADCIRALADEGYFAIGRRDLVPIPHSHSESEAEGLDVDDIRRARIASRKRRVSQALTELGNILLADIRVIEHRTNDGGRVLLLDPMSQAFDGHYDIDRWDVAEKGIPKHIASRLRADGLGMAANYELLIDRVRSLADDGQFLEGPMLLCAKPNARHSELPISPSM